MVLFELLSIYDYFFFNSKRYIFPTNQFEATVWWKSYQETFVRQFVLIQIVNVCWWENETSNKHLSQSFRFDNVNEINTLSRSHFIIKKKLEIKNYWILFFVFIFGKFLMKNCCYLMNILVHTLTKIEKNNECQYHLPFAYAFD